MTTLRLESGVCISSDNPSIIQQYLKYGAVELKKEQKPNEDETPSKKKTTKSKE